MQGNCVPAQAAIEMLLIVDARFRGSSCFWFFISQLVLDTASLHTKWGGEPPAQRVTMARQGSNLTHEAILLKPCQPVHQAASLGNGQKGEDQFYIACTYQFPAKDWCMHLKWEDLALTSQLIRPSQAPAESRAEVSTHQLTR